MQNFIRTIRTFVFLPVLVSSLSFTNLFSASPDEEDISSVQTMGVMEQVISRRVDDSFMIDGIVSSLSGQVSTTVQDMVVKGAQDLTIERHYHAPAVLESYPLTYRKTAFTQSSAHDLFGPEWRMHDHDTRYYLMLNHLRSNYRGWLVLPHCHLTQVRKSPFVVRHTDPAGYSVDIRIESDGSGTLIGDLHGVTNASNEGPGGQHDLRNLIVRSQCHTWKEARNGNEITLQQPSGSVLHYLLKEGRSKKDYLLDREVLANGKVIKYHYNSLGQVVRIASMDPQLSHEYASIEISGDAASGSCRYQSHVSDEVVHTYQTRVHKLEYYKPWNPKESKRELCLGPPILVDVSSPCLSNKSIDYNGNYCLSSCHASHHPFQCTYTPIQEPDVEKFYAVSSIQYPIGENSTPVAVHTFLNERTQAGRVLKVRHHDHSTTTFHYSSCYLPTKVLYQHADGQLYKETRYEWTDNCWQHSVEVLDGEGKLLYRKEFEYDSFGNPVLTTLTGDLKGDGVSTSTSVGKQYSQDGRHLLLQETNEDGVITHYSYLAGTNLILAKLTSDNERIVKRTFNQYDPSYNLVTEIEDDGSSSLPEDLSNVTQRLIKRITYRQESPNLHMPEWQSECYLDDGQEKLLKKTHYHYDTRGYVCQEDVYDATGTFVYSLFKEHNAKGDLLSETNALGQAAQYTYDANGRRLSSTSFAGLTTHFTYDAQGRPASMRQRASDGTERITHHRLDAKNRLVERIDHLGNSTHYAYAPFGRQPTQIIKPSVEGIDGDPIAVTEQFEYDALGREVAHTDPNGVMTQTTYTVYDHPADVIYADGTRDIYRYSATGRLIRHNDRQDLTIVYTYDAFDRVTSKTYFKHDVALGTESFTYDAFHLKSKTDLEGNCTLYTYDKAGRLIREECAGKVRVLSYDALGRICSETHENKDNSLQRRFEYDLLGRLIKRTKSDATGHVLYLISKSYDAAGNVATITRYPEAGAAVDSYRYDAWGRLVEQRDPLGASITTRYDEEHRNSLGQKVLTTIQRDKAGVITYVTHDAVEREVERKVQTADGQILAHHQMYYDPAGNLTERRDHLWAARRYLDTQSIRYSYTPFNEVKSLCRAYGTPEARTVLYAYYPDGQLATQTKADGTVLYYAYDAFGHLAKLHASDGSLLHTFKYNRLGHLLTTEDKASKIIIERSVDAFGRILSESINGTNRLQKTYDQLGRTLTLECPGIAKTLYSYDPLYMRSVTFHRLKDNTQARHSYLKYDLDGNLCEELLPFDCGKVTRTNDLRGRHRTLEGQFFSQYCHYDARDNLITLQEDEKRAEYTYDGLSQLTTEATDGVAEYYEHDSNYNCVVHNDDAITVNALNEPIADPSTSYHYDLNGNLIAKTCGNITTHYAYDALDRLVQVMEPNVLVGMTYDPIGRRMSRVTYQNQQKADCEYYFYDDEEEIGAFDEAGQLLQLRSLGRARYRGMSQCLLVDLNGKLFVPVTDFQNNMRRLIDPMSKTVSGTYDYSAFGQQTNVVEAPGLFNPWRYASKRFDAKTQMVYFGKRYYMPGMQRWLTTDPIGFTEGTNLYTFLLNSPFRYVDPDGQFAFVLAIPLLEFTAAGLTWMALPTLGQMAWGVTACAALYCANEYGGLIGQTAAELLSELANSQVNGTAAAAAAGASVAAGAGGHHPDDDERDHRSERSKKDNKHKQPQQSLQYQKETFNAAFKTIQRQIGRQLTKYHRDELHKAISKKGYDYWEIVQVGLEMFGS